MPWHVATLIKDRAQEVQGYEGIFKFRGGKGAKKKKDEILTPLKNEGSG